MRMATASAYEAAITDLQPRQRGVVGLPVQIDSKACSTSCSMQRRVDGESS